MSRPSGKRGTQIDFLTNQRPEPPKAAHAGHQDIQAKGLEESNSGTVSAPKNPSATGDEQYTTISRQFKALPPIQNDYSLLLAEESSSVTKANTNGPEIRLPEKSAPAKRFRPASIPIKVRSGSGPKWNETAGEVAAKVQTVSSRRNEAASTLPGNSQKGSGPQGNRTAGKPPIKRKFDAIEADARGPEIRAQREAPVKRPRRPTPRVESPWEKYDKEYTLTFDEKIIVATKKNPTEELFGIRAFSGPDADSKLDTLYRIQADHFVEWQEVYRDNGEYWVVFEHMPLSLVQVIGMPKPLDEAQIAAILSPVSSPTSTQCVAALMGDSYCVALTTFNLSVLFTATSPVGAFFWMIRAKSKYVHFKSPPV